MSMNVSTGVIKWQVLLSEPLNEVDVSAKVVDSAGAGDVQSWTIELFPKIG